MNITFRSEYGSASRSDDLAGITNSNQFTSSAITGVNDDNVGPTWHLVTN